MEIKRDTYLTKLTSRMGNGMIKVVTGVRRCGKSYLLLNLFEDWLREHGVSQAQIVEVVLDAEENAALREPAALSAHLKERTPDPAKTYYVLIDEVQYAISAAELRDRDNPPRLYGVLNGLLRRRNVDVYVTGSNSKLLSTDVMTEFRGRGDEVRVRPLSFSEFAQTCIGGAQAGGFRQAWGSYATWGGMPLVPSLEGDEQKASYLTNLFAETYFKDIIERCNLRKTQELDDLMNVLASNIGSLTSTSKIRNTFKSTLRSNISENTIAAYLGHLKDAFLIDEVQRFDVKGRRYIDAPKKYYFADVGLRNARLGFRQLDEPHIMENVVYNELAARGFSVDVGVVERRVRDAQGHQRREQLEVDFVANRVSARYYIQVALGIDEPGKESQEKRSLKTIPDSFKKVLVLRDVLRPHYDDDGFLVLGLEDFLLNEHALEL